MPMDQLLSRSAELEQKLESFFGAPLCNTSKRLEGCKVLTSLGFEHAMSLKHLVAAGLHSSAAALLRVQFESLVRAMWILYVATEAEAELMVSELTDVNAKKASKIPMLAKMLDDIEMKAPHAPVTHLKEFKYYSWKPLSSFVHGGIHAVSRHGQGFPMELVLTMIRHSNGLLGMAGNLLLIIAGVPAEAGTMTKLYSEFEDCLPLVNPPFRRKSEQSY